MENNRKKLGIIGYWFATNYGGVASYYSLYHNLREWGYAPFLVENPYYYTDKEGVDVFSRNLFKEINAEISEPYDNEHLNSLNEKADTFILGSDQVLTRSSIRAFGKLFLMEFSDEKKKRIAVSASLGGDNLDGDENLIKYAQKQIQRFTKVSIREFTGLNVARDKFGIKADFMIDPIFFTPAEEYTALGKKAELSETQESYLLAYILDPTDDKREGILKTASILGLKKKVALDGRKFTHDKNFAKMNLPEDTLPELDFKEWMNYYSNASYIVTDSFHGAAMALILNKPFVVYANHQRGYPRFLTLVKLFGIKDRLIERTEEITEILIHSKPDFTEINRIITEYVAQAKAWIIQTIDSDPKDIESIEMPKRSVNAQLNEKECTGCGACVNICPKDAIEFKNDEWGYYRAKVDPEKCVDCGICVKTCPAIKLPENNNSLSAECYEFIANDENILMNSSSGGIFSVMAKELFKKNGMVGGAAWTEDFTVKHILIDNIKDLPKLQKSKYLQSYIGTVFRDVKQNLEKGKDILFTGCPCQIAGLKSYLRKEYDNLITVDLLCGNAPSPMFFQKYLSESFPEGLNQYNFRSKVHGYTAECISIVKKDGEKLTLRGPKEDAYQRVYHNHTMCAPHCEKCKYQTLPRFGDITIGDFWGISGKDKSIDVSKGVSVVLCNNEKGKAFLKSIPPETAKVLKKVPLEWLGGNGFAIKGSHNYASSFRNLFYDAVQKMDFSKAVNYALKPNHGMYNPMYKDINIPLMLNSSFNRFRFDPNVWEEHLIDGKITLHVKSNQWHVKRYANLPLARPLEKGKTYLFNIRFKIKSAYHLINFHLRDSGTGCIQIIDTFHIPSGNDGNIWYEVNKKIVPDTDLYDQFMIGASQVSGAGNYFMIDYITIKKL